MANPQTAHKNNFSFAGGWLYYAALDDAFNYVAGTPLVYFGDTGDAHLRKQTRTADVYTGDGAQSVKAESKVVSVSFDLTIVVRDNEHRELRLAAEREHQDRCCGK